MNKMQKQVEEFHLATSGLGTIETREGRFLRAKLILEEAAETIAALGLDINAAIYEKADRPGWQVYTVDETGKFDYLEYLDGLCDLLYVTFGGAVNAGRDIEPHFDEVHAANMRKLDGPKDEHGKQLKPKGWYGPDHEGIIERYPSYP